MRMSVSETETKKLHKIPSDLLKRPSDLFRRLIKHDLGKPFIAFLATFIMAVAFSPSLFLTVYNQEVLAQQASIYMLLGLGEALVILLGSIDLSAANVYGLSLMIAGYVYAYLTHSLLISILASLATGALFGAVNGVLVAKVKMYSFIATLATSLIAFGFMLVLTRGQSIYPLPAFSVLDLNVHGLPLPFIIAVALTLVIYLLLRSTVLGRYIYAIGGNEDATYYSGVNIEGVKIITFTLAGLMYSLASLILLGMLQAATPEAVTGNILLYAIAAAVLGGVELTGGVGSSLGPIFGAYVLVIISNILVLLNINIYAQYVVSGILLLIIVISLSRGKKWVK
jgi:ribose/xylose/arabinose/galactoside ABC-type transport system permease subunit